MNSLLSFKLPATADGRAPVAPEAFSYRFLSNIASADLDRARQAARIAGPDDEFRLVPITCSELGLPVRGAALYGLAHQSEPAEFWRLFHSLAPRSAA